MSVSDDWNAPGAGEPRSWGEGQLGGAGRGSPPPAGGGHGGAGGVNALEARVSTLESDFRYVRRDLDQIAANLSILPNLATKRDLETWRWQWLATGIGIVALVITGVVGGLALINHYAAAGPPAVSQPPAAPQIIVVPGYGPPSIAPPKGK